MDGEGSGMGERQGRMSIIEDNGDNRSKIVEGSEEEVRGPGGDGGAGKGQSASSCL